VQTSSRRSCAWFRTARPSGPPPPPGTCSGTIARIPVVGRGRASLLIATDRPAYLGRIGHPLICIQVPLCRRPVRCWQRQPRRAPRVAEASCERRLAAAAHVPRRCDRPRAPVVTACTPMAASILVDHSANSNSALRARHN
jgi:hypothetical protein